MYYTPNATEGRFYEQTKNLSLTEIAKLVRADIKLAVKAGKLPKDIKVSVRSEYFSNGCALEINWSSPTYKYIEVETYGEDYELNYYSAEREAIDQELKAITNLYNYHDCDAQIDYFNVRFYCNPSDDYSRRNWTNIKDISPELAETAWTFYKKDGMRFGTAYKTAQKLLEMEVK